MVSIQAWRSVIGCFDSKWNNSATQKCWHFIANCSKATRSYFGTRNQRLCALLVDILILANDTETNPGPDTRRRGNSKDQSTRTENLWGSRPLHQEASGGRKHTEEQGIRSILAEINRKLGRLESLDSQLKLLNYKIDTIDQKQDKLKEENERLRNRVESLENKMAYQEGQSKRETLYFMDYLNRQMRHGTCVREM